jgi:glucose dehydrogenase
MTGNSALRLAVLLIVLLAACACSEQPAEPTSIQDKVSFHHLEGYLAATPVVEEGFLYATTGAGAVHKLDLSTGRRIWTYDEIGGYINSPPLVTEGAVIAIGAKGTLVALNKHDGGKRWAMPEEPRTKWMVQGEEVDPPLILGSLGYDPATRTIVTVGAEGTAFGIDAGDGTVRWMRELGARTLAPPAFREGDVFVATMDGKVHALNAWNGTDVWALPKVVAIGAAGSLRDESEEEADTELTGTPYVLTVKYMFNFDVDDHFEHEGGPGADIEIVPLDEFRQPIRFIDDDEEKTAVAVSDINPADHQGSHSHLQMADLILASAPPVETHWPVTIVVRDAAGAVLDSLDTRVSFRPDGEETAAVGEPGPDEVWEPLDEGMEAPEPPGEEPAA